MKAPLCWCKKPWGCKAAQILMLCLSPKKVFPVCLVTCISTEWMVICMRANGIVLFLTFSFVSFLATFIQSSALQTCSMSTLDTWLKLRRYCVHMSCVGAKHYISREFQRACNRLLWCVQQTIMLENGCWKRFCHDAKLNSESWQSLRAGWSSAIWAAVISSSSHSKTSEGWQQPLAACINSLSCCWTTSRDCSCLSSWTSRCAKHSKFASKECVHMGIIEEHGINAGYSCCTPHFWCDEYSRRIWKRSR